MCVTRMLLHYRMERILPPTTGPAQSRAAWTEEGMKYREECREARDKGHYKPGEHYTAIEGENRILMTNLPQIHGLRHCWCWEARSRPHLPTWSFAKVPRPQLSPEENARLLCVYLRPWTLRETGSTRTILREKHLASAIAFVHKRFPLLMKTLQN